MSGLPDRITPFTQKQFEETYGGSLICCQVTLVLYGFSCLQTYLYFIKYEKDRLLVKLMVLGVWILGSLHAFCMANTVYHYLVLSYTNPMLLIGGEWSVYAGTAIGMVVCFIVQIFFARTIYHLTRKKVRLAFTLWFALMILAQVGFGITYSAKLFILWDLLRLKEVVYSVLVPLLFIRVATDATTAVALCYLLYNTKTNFKKSMKLVNTLIIYAINRFVLTACVVLFQAIILIARPDTVWAMVVEFVAVSLYINSFLATLNSRNHLREMEGATDYTTSSGTKARANSQGPGVMVTTTSTHNVDITRPVNLSFKDTEGQLKGQDLELSEIQYESKGSPGMHAV